MLCVIYSYVASGVYATEQLLKETNVVEVLFKFIVINKGEHNYKLSNGIMREFSILLINLINVGDDWCFDTLIGLGLVDCLFSLICEVRYGYSICVDALECIEQLLA